MEPNNPTLQGLFQAYQQLQQSFTNSQNEVHALRNQLQATHNQVQQVGSSSSAGLNVRNLIHTKVKAQLQAGLPI